MKSRWLTVLFAWLITLGCAACLSSTSMTLADEPPDLPRIQLVFFTPSDVAPPTGHTERLTELANYTEAFFVRWMKHWRYSPARTTIFDRETNGQVVVRHVRGKHSAASSVYDNSTLVAEVQRTAIPQYKIPRNLHVWWVHVYLGPDREYTDYRGSGNVSDGGSAVVRYSTLAGIIDPHQEILEGFHEKYHLKGIIHELGHAFGLPHLGPRKRDGFGNTLMGPNQFEWKRIAKAPEPRGYLSEAAAAMLWRHPLFSGSTEKRRQMPEVNVDRLRCQFDRNAKRIRVNGRVQSDIGAHSVIVVDASTAAPSNYWHKAYVGRVGEDGAFQVDVTELAPADGFLQIVFCFNNGSITGDGKERGLKSAITRSYRYRNRAIIFSAPEAENREDPTQRTGVGDETRRQRAAGLPKAAKESMIVSEGMLAQMQGTLWSVWTWMHLTLTCEASLRQLGHSCGYCWGRGVIGGRDGRRPLVESTRSSLNCSWPAARSFAEEVWLYAIVCKAASLWLLRYPRLSP